jgi:hypothetical protein
VLKLKYVLLAFASLTLGWGISAFTNKNVLVVTEVPRPFTELADAHQDSLTSAQHPFVKVYDLTVKAHTTYTNITFDHPFTSFVIELLDGKDLFGAWYQSAEGEHFTLDSLHGMDQPDKVIRSSFVIPNKVQNSFNLYSGSMQGKIRIYVLYAPPIQLNYTNYLKKRNALCEKPAMVLGTEWREGLPDPVGQREVNQVAHCIIHHAAGSNTSTEYTNVVRNIYLLHTQTNGWDDIGYNFLVAQNGVIFEGRDPQGVADIDNVKGAHFCGKNTGTMGICVLGNYQEVRPTQASLNSVKDLLTWKCYKDQINPFGRANHPDINGSALQRLAGHRDGCATACPGDSLYLHFNSIRNQVQEELASCGLVLDVQKGMELSSPFFVIIQNSSNRFEFKISDKYATSIQDMSIQTIEGKPIMTWLSGSPTNNYVVKNLKPAIYVLQARTSLNKLVSEKYLVNP